jgi:hypothetical protein
MQMLPISEFNENITGRILVLDPSYPIGHEMRIRIVDAQFIKHMADVTHFIPLVDMEPKEENIYQQHGYKNREDYLQSLSEEYDVDIEVVYQMADILGEEEDFDGLVTNLEDGERW